MRRVMLVKIFRGEDTMTAKYKKLDVVSQFYFRIISITLNIHLLHSLLRVLSTYTLNHIFTFYFTNTTSPKCNSLPFSLLLLLLQPPLQLMV